MKNKLIIVLTLPTILVAIYFVVGIGSESEHHAAIDKSQKMKTVTINQKIKTLTESKQEMASVPAVPQSLSTTEQTYAVWGELKQLLIQGEVNISLEKRLINSLRSAPDQQVYTEIRQLLQQPDDNFQTRNQEYLLSLLAEINSNESVQLFLTTLENTPITDSNAIYATKVAIQRLTNTDKHLSAFELSFTTMASDNNFLTDIANGIARNAHESDFDFIVAHIDSAGDKSTIAMNSMTNMTSERLVPKIQKLIATREPNTKLSHISLKTLANMGQYEAVAALIQWSATQPTSANTLVTELFTIAGNRSPSTYRAIEKELNDYQFASAEIKQIIENIYSKK
jgi:hypothetical protein